MTLQELIAIPLGNLILVFIAAGARFTMPRAKDADPPTLWLLFGSVLWALFLVLGSYQLLFEYRVKAVLTDGWVTLITSALAFFAKDILISFLKLADKVKQDPLAFLRKLLDLWKPSINEDKNL